MRRSRQQELLELEAAILASQDWLEAGCPENFFSPHMLGQLSPRIRLRLIPTATTGVYGWVVASRIRILCGGQLETTAAEVPSSSPSERDSPTLQAGAKTAPTPPRRTRRGARGKRQHAADVAAATETKGLSHLPLSPPSPSPFFLHLDRSSSLGSGPADALGPHPLPLSSHPSSGSPLAARVDARF
jgi:hypothetical protein